MLTESIKQLERELDALARANAGRDSDTVFVVRRTDAADRQPDTTGQRRLTRQEELRRQQQNELYNREINRANQLQAEIRRLQDRLAYEQRSYPNYPSNANYSGYPATTQRVITVPNSAAPGNEAYYPGYNQYNPPATNTMPVRDTVYVNDTIYVRDTLIVRDTTFNPAKRDTLIRMVPAKPQTIYVPVEKEKIVKESIDYTELPEDVVLFDVGKSAIKSVYHKRLDYLSGILKKAPALQAIITGHTDKTGPPAVNRALSEKRANAVKAYFTGKGVNPDQLIIKAAASTDPAVQGNTSSAYSQNRRVTIKLEEQQ